MAFTDMQSKVVRPVRRPPGGLPFSVRAVGHYQMVSPFQSDIFDLPFVQILWCASGFGTVMINGAACRMSANQVAVYLPGMRHDWRTMGAPWDVHWVVLDGALAEPFVRAYGLRPGLHASGSPPLQLFAQLFQAMKKHSRPGEVLCCELAFGILSRAALQCGRCADAIADRAEELIHQKWDNPGFNIKTLADELGIARSTLDRRFYRTHGVRPMVYIHRLRVQNALSLLSDSELKIAEVARRCGFNDSNYFSRLIRNACGLSPLRLRQQSRDGHGLPAALGRRHGKREIG